MSDSESKEDWRLRGQERYLQGVKLQWRDYVPYREGWEHDHCEFCSAKFMVKGNSGVLHEGYATEDQYYWVCAACFEDFKHRFRWVLA